MLRQAWSHIVDRNGHLTVAGTALLLAAAGMVLMGQGPQPARVVEAQEFVVRDASGKVRARLGMLDTATAALSLYDAAENVRARLVVGDRPALMLADAARSGPYARWRLALGVGNMGGGDSGPHLLMWDSGGTSRVELYVAQDKSGLFLYGRTGELLFNKP